MLIGTRRSSAVVKSVCRHYRRLASRGDLGARAALRAYRTWRPRERERQDQHLNALDRLGFLGRQAAVEQALARPGRRAATSHVCDRLVLAA